ncbi:peptide/nickel transport system permease protein [Paenibacillus sp. V4I9]|uniref:ABC transporter permease n=1 Tax=Paenibacillus sp. V4I9 TaxID=3042308 RepID=UPI00277D2761|nr:ABC transporter permease [Paenibacillus sp. V4I9]MDQ0889803.1 peptide/nickel transport system permease protein [Paenibacillus sp. V4I9]
MKIYILWRLLSLIPVMLIVAVVVFLIIHLTPGDPAAVMLGQDASPDMVEKLRHDLGFDRPLWEQFVSWFLGIFKGDLGMSIFLKQPVLKLFVDHLGPTLSLAILAQGISILIAIPMGITAARKRGTAIDQVFMMICLLGISLPSFLLALLLSLLFAVNLGWLPVAGYGSLSGGLWMYFKYLILPAISLGVIQAAFIARMTRSSMLDVLNMNYMKTAYAKGVKEFVLVYKHALRNAFIPILTVIGQTFGGLIAGAVVTETVFNIPGIGQLLVQAMHQRDIAIIQGVVLLIAASYVLINLLVDLLYGVVDPRVRLSRKS